jgi:hypothetical protein
VPAQGTGAALHCLFTHPPSAIQASSLELLGSGELLVTNNTMVLGKFSVL